jgi:hypothetical protein
VSTYLGVCLVVAACILVFLGIVAYRDSQKIVGTPISTALEATVVHPIATPLLYTCWVFPVITDMETISITWVETRICGFVLTINEILSTNSRTLVQPDYREGG